MQEAKFNIILDGQHGSSGKGKMSTYLAHKYQVTNVSSANFPNAGHSFVHKDYKFVAKAIPTAAGLKKVFGIGMNCFISPGSGFDWKRLIQEWDESGRPRIFVHERASVVTNDHKVREERGADSTKHIASTMQGTAAALADKILRKKDTALAYGSASEGRVSVADWARFLSNSDPDINALFDQPGTFREFTEKVQVVAPNSFRDMTWNLINEGHSWLHEGSQGYALSIDHGSHYPNCTSRNCTTQAAMDYMAIPPKMVGDIYLNLRTFPIRVGNVVEGGEQLGHSGDFYPDSTETTWEAVADGAGMPPEERALLAERERTTVTKRIRRVSTFSFQNLADAVKTNGITKLCVNFVQYLNWKDNGLRGNRSSLSLLSKETRDFVARVEDVANLPVVLIGTGAAHDDIIDLM